MSPSSLRLQIVATALKVNLHFFQFSLALCHNDIVRKYNSSPEALISFSAVRVVRGSSSAQLERTSRMPVGTTETAWSTNVSGTDVSTADIRSVWTWEWEEKVNWSLNCFKFQFKHFFELLWCCLIYEWHCPWPTSVNTPGGPYFPYFWICSLFFLLFVPRLVIFPYFFIKMLKHCSFTTVFLKISLLPHI